MVDTAAAASDSSVADRVADALYGEPDEGQDDEGNLEDDIELDADSDEVNLDDQDSDDGVDEGDDEPNTEGDDDPTLASYLGLEEAQISEDDDGNIMFSANVDGEIQSIPMSKLVQGYQTDGYNTQRSMKLSEEIKSFEEERTRITEEAQVNLQSSLFIVDQLEKDLLTEYNSIDWQGLRTNNPTEFVALRQDYADKANKVEGMKTNAQNAMQEYQLRTNDIEMKQNQLHIAEEREKLNVLRPELSDNTVFEAVMTKARGFLKTKYGVSDEDVAQIHDHKLVSIILDAQQFHLGKEQVKKKKKSGKKIPKFNKSGGNRGKLSAKNKGVKARRAKLQETGTINDAASLLIDRM